jgi:hypothetical protein
MPTYYVRPDGNDTNTGLAPTNASGTGAFRTVNKALSVAVGGDTVWIAPGVYRENVSPTITLQSLNIDVRGDASLTQVAWGTGLTAGVVRISNNLTNDATAPSGAVLTLSSKGFYTFRNLRFDGWMTFTSSPSVFFDDCVVYAGCKESSFTQINESPVMTVSFRRCSLFEFPAYFNNANYPVACTVLFASCFMTACINADRASHTNSGGTVTNFYHLQASKANSNNTYMSNYWNCTLAPGRNQPNYIFACNAWSGRPAMTVTNCLILSVPVTNTFTNDFSNQVQQSYNAGFVLSNNSFGPGTGNVTLNSMPVDIQEGYKESVYQYLPYTPLLGSAIIGAGANTTFGNFSTPTYDFSNNIWNQANPTIGYMDNRQVSTIPSTAGYVPLDRAIQTITVTSGSTGVSVHVYLGSTGVNYQTPNLTCYYARDNGATVYVPLVAGNASTWVSGGLFEVSSTTMPGVYKFDIPNDVMLAGAKSASIMLRGANAFNGAFVNVNIENPATSSLVSTNEFKLYSEDSGNNGILELNQNSTVTTKIQLLDMYDVPVNIGTATCSVQVYNSNNNLVATYTPVVQYAGNGELSFVLTSTVTATAGDYNVYCVRSAGASDSVVYGPLALKVRRL